MKLLKKLLSYFPSRLPVGMTAWKQWSKDIIELAGPIANAEDMEAAIAMEVVHGLKPGRAYIPKNYMVTRLIKTAANQIASAAYLEIKNARDAQIKALQEEAAKQATVADTSVASSEASSGSTQVQ